MEKTRKGRRTASAETIARLAEQGEDGPIRQPEIRKMRRWDAVGDLVGKCFYSCMELTFLLSVLVSAVLLAQVNPPAETGKLGPKNFEVLGITLGTSEFTDLQRILGPGTSRETPEHEGFVTCYCSPGDDRTVLEFDSWIGTMVEFRFFGGSPQEVTRCTKSRLVSKSLATASGVRLGMSRSEVMTLLGAPTKMQEGHFIYESSYDRLPTPEEVKHSNDAFGPLPALISVHEKIDLSFGRGKVVRVEVLRGNEIAK
jgi:hypothetical protein